MAAGGAEAKAGPELPLVRVCTRGPSVPSPLRGSLPHVSWPWQLGGGQARAQSVAGTSAQPRRAGWAFHVVSSISTAGRELVFHHNSPGLVSCLRDNCWFILKG